MKNEKRRKKVITKNKKVITKINKRDIKKARRALTKSEKVLANELQVLFEKIERQEYSKKFKKARSDKQRLTIKAQKFTGNEKYKFIYYNKKDKRIEKYLTIKEIKKRISKNTELIFFPSDNTFRTIKEYSIKFSKSDQELMRDFLIRDFDFLFELVVQKYIKLFRKIKKPYEFYAFHLEYFDGETLDRISNPLADFDNLLINKLDDDEIFNLFIKDRLDRLLLEFISKIEKYLAKNATDIYFTKLILKIYNDLPKKGL